MKKIIMILICLVVFINNSNSCDCKYSKYGYWDNYMVKANSKKSKLNTYLSEIKVNEIRPLYLASEHYGSANWSISTMKFIYKNDVLNIKICSYDGGVDGVDGMDMDVLENLFINNKRFPNEDYDRKILILLQKKIYKKYREYFLIKKIKI